MKFESGLYLAGTHASRVQARRPGTHASRVQARRRRAYPSLCLAAIITLIAGASLLAPGQAVQHSPLPFARGEELVYQAEFSRALLRGVDVAEFRFNSTSEHIARGTDDPIILHLTGDVVSKGLFPRIAGFKFHQHIESTADAEPFTTLRTTRSEEQGKRVRQIEGVFDHQTRKATWIERQPNQRTTSIDFTEPIQDVLTAIYFLRTQQLDVGKSFEVLLSDSGRVYRVPVNVVERKTMDTAVGRVKAIRIEPALFGDDALLHARGQLSIWLTEDERHLPVRAQLKMEIGTFDIKLKRVTYSDATAK
ncbi:MAG TPA: DUF3108 domain-containing protein [Pyrinomonadaceae bacterium]|nr:DUF3108 domain-containing protein [Pyrinomonadaceae bacterium]